MTLEEVQFSRLIKGCIVKVKYSVDVQAQLDIRRYSAVCEDAKKGDIYYVPIDINPQNMYEEYYWDNDDVDIKYYRMGLVCNTPEEAIAKTRRILATV